MAFCDVKAVRHSVCMVTLVLALGLSVTGVVAPWWRVQEEEGITKTEGLWQQCLRVGMSHRTCQFSQRNSGLWRAVQVVKLTSLALLLCAVVMLMAEALCSPCCRCCCYCCRSSRRPSPLRSQRRCLPASFFAALLAGVTGLTGDLLYVGYSQHHTQPEPNQFLYYWSFALSVGGSCLSLIAALALGVTAFVLWTRRPAPKLPPHWADHIIYNPERMSGTSWRYFPSGAFYHDDLRPAPFQPYFSSEDSRKVSPYDRHSLYSGNPYQGRDRHFGGGDDDRYELYQPGTFPEKAPPSRSSSLRGLYSEDSVRGAYTNAGFEDLEAQMDFSAEEAPGEDPPNAPKESAPIQSSEVPVMEGSLPGYSSQSGEHKRAGSRSTVSSGTSASGDPLIRPRSHSAPPSGPIKSRQQRSEGAAPPLPPPSEAEMETAETRPSEVTSDVTPQTRSGHHFPDDSATTSSSRSTGHLRYVKFEDEALVTSTLAEAGTPDPTVRPIRGSRHDAESDPGYGNFQISRGARDPSLEREYRRRRQEHERRVSRQWEAQDMSSAFPRHRADFRQREAVEGGTAFQRPRSTLRHPRQSYQRQSFPPPSNMPVHYEPAEFAAWNRRQEHRRKEMRPKRSKSFDSHHFDHLN